MRKQTITIGIYTLAAMLLSVAAHSQRDTMWWKAGKWSAWGVRYQTQTFGVSENKLDTCNCGDDARGITSRGNVGLLVSYYGNVTPRFAYSVGVGASYGRVGTRETPTLLAKEDWFLSFRGDAYYHVGKTGQRIMPYLHTGMQAQLGSYASLPLGGGIRWMLKKSPVFFTTQLDYGLGLTNHVRNSLLGSIGVYVASVTKKAAIPKAVVPAAPVKQLVDKDGDGISDDVDLCPTVKGTLEGSGCPIMDSDGDGVVDEKDKCPSLAGSIRNYGCPVIDSDGDGVVDEKDKCPSIKGVIRNEGCPESDQITKVIPKDLTDSKNVIVPPSLIIYFDIDKYDVKPRYDSALTNAIAFLKENSSYNVVLKGHTDIRASLLYNEKLSSRRVDAVKEILIRGDISSSRILTSYFGELLPADPGNSDSSYSRNRRVEVIFYEKR